jgi:hypothetical protein
MVKSKLVPCNLGVAAGLESMEVGPIQVVEILALVRRNHSADKTLHTEKVESSSFASKTIQTPPIYRSEIT